MSRATRLVCGGFACLAGILAAADTPRPASESRSKIDAEHREAIDRADRTRLERLTTLAASQLGADADATYLEIFRFAIATDRYREAEPAAERYLASGGGLSREIEFLARLVNLIGEADRGDYNGAMADLKAYVDSPSLNEGPALGLQTRTLLAIGEAFVRRLLLGARFDNAREVCELIVQKTQNPAVREHFQGYLNRLKLVGNPAPVVEGRDVDGKPIRLADMRGKVVLVTFWATWCPPCVESLPAQTAALERFGKEGFAVLGVNLDTGPDRDKAVRKFLVEYGVPWPNVLSGEGNLDLAKTYGVSEIPANVLIGRDGKVLTLDVSPGTLAEAAAKALAK